MKIKCIFLNTNIIKTQCNVTPVLKYCVFHLNEKNGGQVFLFLQQESRQSRDVDAGNREEQAQKIVDISRSERCYCETPTFCPVDRRSYYTFSGETGSSSQVTSTLSSRHSWHFTMMLCLSFSPNNSKQEEYFHKVNAVLSAISLH